MINSRLSRVKITSISFLQILASFLSSIFSSSTAAQCAASSHSCAQLHLILVLPAQTLLVAKESIRPNYINWSFVNFLLLQMITANVWPRWVVFSGPGVNTKYNFSKLAISENVIVTLGVLSLWLPPTQAGLRGKIVKHSENRFWLSHYLSRIHLCFSKHSGWSMDSVDPAHKNLPLQLPSGVNICPNKSETGYQPIRSKLKLSVPAQPKS